MGRIILPKRLREQLSLEVGTEFKFYLHNEDGDEYLCIKVGKACDEILKAKEILERAGFEVGTRTDA